MKVFIQSEENGIPRNQNLFCAYCGFKEMGFEIIPFSHIEQLNAQAEREDIVAGHIGAIRQRLTYLGLPIPELGYPQELSHYLGRKIWNDTINHINNSPELWPVFIKPHEDKRFTGVLVRSPKDLMGCGSDGTDFPVYCSEPVDFVAEWRCFVRYGKILDVRRYSGNWKCVPDYDLMEKVVSEYTSAPNGYGIDFGLTSEGRTLFLEVNEGYSLGTYGLLPNKYAKLLSARWAELTGTTDECNF